MAREPGNKHSIIQTCPWWLLFTFDNPLRKLVQDPERILSPYVNQGDIVMDLGCGMGYFSIALARLVGNTGKVIAVDLQQQMLDGLRRRANKAKLVDRITPHLCTPDQIGVTENVDFALAFWMVHEVSDTRSFLEQVYRLMGNGGRFMIVEPYFHVTARRFDQTVLLAKDIGFIETAHPRVWMSRAVLLSKS